MARKLDPLEEAKRSAAGKPLDPLEAPPPPEPKPAAQLAIEDELGVPRQPAKPVESHIDVAIKVASPPPRAPKKLYRVLGPHREVIGGHIVHFKLGDEIDPVGYGGEGWLEKAQKRGLKVEPFTK